MPAKINRLHETNITKKGQKIEIIAYRNNKDVDIQFEDGTIVKHRYYSMFASGSIKNPTLKKQKPHKKPDPATLRINETNIASNGQSMKIIAYRKCYDIDVQFEDDTIVQHITYADFQKGYVKNPNLTHVGETSIASNGQTMTIIEFHKSDDVTIQFDDETIVYNKRYDIFKDGFVKNPNKPWSNYKRIGEKKKAGNGQMMEIIEYKKQKDITVKFEDGTIVHTTYDSFTDGRIKNPNFKPHLHETRRANNGQMMTIIDYKSNQNITVQFDDNTVVTNKRYNTFCKGAIANPTQPIGNHLLPYITKNNIKVTGLAYKYDYQCNMFCQCLTCQEKMILTYDEMKKHICKPLT